VDYFKQIKDLERKGDRVSNTIFEELNTTFITPFDREDIHDLANVLDDVIDFINSCAKRIVMYHPKKMPEPATTLGELLISAADYIGSSVKELDTLQKNSDKIKDNCSKLHEIEHTADDVYEHFIMGLFENPTDPLEIIKLKEIMHSLEQATDAAERVAKIIKTIIVKYS
jgi:predicted phosphate transport protein (TIGR00153 family)